MTDQEQNHDMPCDANPSRHDSSYTGAEVVQELEESMEPYRAGIVSHRDQFNEPEQFSESTDFGRRERSEARMRQLLGSLKVRSAQRPSSPSPARASKPKLNTLFLTSGYSIKPGSYGGILLRGTTVFGKTVEIQLREIKSIEPIPEFSDCSLEQVSLKETAEKLFVTCDCLPYNHAVSEHWEHYLEHIAIPVIENMTEHWIGASSPGISNPVTEFFFGHNGILRNHLNRSGIIHRLRSIRSNPIVPLLTRYKGPAMVVVYEE